MLCCRCSCSSFILHWIERVQIVLFPKNNNYLPNDFLCCILFTQLSKKIYVCPLPYSKCTFHCPLDPVVAAFSFCFHIFFIFSSDIWCCFPFLFILKSIYHNNNITIIIIIIVVVIVVAVIVPPHFLLHVVIFVVVVL